MLSNLLKGGVIYFCVQLLVSLVVTDDSQSFIACGVRGVHEVLIWS